MKNNQIPLPKLKSILESLGINIKLARKRRKISTVTLARRAGITRPTLLCIENGAGSTSVVTLLRVLNSLGLENDLELVAKDDVLGRKLQDIELLGEYNENTSDFEIPKSRGKLNAATAYRRATALGAVPSTLTIGELKLIEDLYEKANEISIKTGIPHHVDHIIPLMGKTEKGLHILSNLQILLGTENCKKGNKIISDL